MGCDIYCVLQKRDDKTGKFETLAMDIIPFRDYNLFAFLSGIRGFAGEHDNIAHSGFPTDFKVEQRGTEYFHQGIYMGSHTPGYISLREFCEAKTPNFEDKKKFEVEQLSNGYMVTFLDVDYLDEYSSIRALQKGLAAMFGVGMIDYDTGRNYGDNYRLVFGYNS